MAGDIILGIIFAFLFLNFFSSFFLFYAKQEFRFSFLLHKYVNH